jgi:hypothetical protein
VFVGLTDTVWSNKTSLEVSVCHGFNNIRAELRADRQRSRVENRMLTVPELTSAPMCAEPQNTSTDLHCTASYSRSIFSSAKPLSNGLTQSQATTGHQPDFLLNGSRQWTALLHSLHANYSVDMAAALPSDPHGFPLLDLPPDVVMLVLQRFTRQNRAQAPAYAPPRINLHYTAQTVLGRRRRLRTVQPGINLASCCLSPNALQ